MEKAVKSFPVNYDESKILIDKLVLVDSIKEIPVPGHETLADGAVINLSEVGTEYLNIYVDAKEEYVGGVIINFTGKDKKGKYINIRNTRPQRRNKAKETIFPFYVMGDGDFDRNEQPSKWKAEPGNYKLIVTPFGRNNNKGTLGKQFTIKFKIID